jgi:hypothetical protein
MSLTNAIAFLLATYGLWFLFVRQGFCPHCSGRGGHRPDCPRSKHDDRHGDE